MEINRRDVLKGIGLIASGLVGCGKHDLSDLGKIANDPEVCDVRWEVRGERFFVDYKVRNASKEQTDVYIITNDKKIHVPKEGVEIENLGDEFALDVEINGDRFYRDTLTRENGKYSGTKE